MCTQDKCQPACGEHGSCREDGTCSCEANWDDGAQCTQCKAGFSGSNCDTQHGILKVVGLISVGLIVVGGVAFAVWYFRFKRAGVSPYAGLVTNEDIMLEGIGKPKPVESDSSELASSDGKTTPSAPKINEGAADAASLSLSSDSA